MTPVRLPETVDAPETVGPSAAANAVGEIRAPRRDASAVAVGISLNLVGSVASAVLAVGLLILLTRALGTDGAGAFLEAVALFNLAVAIATAGAHTGLVRSVAGATVGDDTPTGQGGLGRLLTIAVVPVALVGGAITLGVLVGATGLAEMFGGENHVDQVRQYITVIAIFVPVAAVTTAVLGATRGFGTMVPTVIIDRIGKPALQLLGVVVGLIVGVSALWLMVAWSLAAPLTLVGATLWLVSLIRRHAVPGSDERTDGDTGPGWWEMTRTFWAFTLPRGFALVFQAGVQWIDVLIVGAMISPAAAAIYTVATRVLQLGMIVNEAVGQATEPMFARLMAKKESDRVSELFKVTTGWVMLLTWPQFIVAAVFAAPVLGLFGSGFAEGAVVVVILAVSAMIGNGAGPVDVVLLMAGKSSWSFWNTAASLTVNIGLNLVLIPQMGISGAALAWALTRLVSNGLPLAQVWRHYGFQPFGRAWLIAATLTLSVFGLGSVVVTALLGPTFPAVIVALTVTVPIYLVLLRTFRDDLHIDALTAVIRRTPTDEVPA